jgi:hypothetical protein
MVIARLWGGLGNQLFQYAAGLALAEGQGADLVLDPTQCLADRNRPYELDRLRISGRVWTEEERRRVERMVRLARPITEATSRAARALKRSLTPLLRHRFTYVEDRHQGYQPEVFDIRGDVYMAGTWASAEYFERIAPRVRAEFAFAQEPDGENAAALARIRACDASVCVHVRRGDYVTVADTSRRFGVCSLDYYRDALAWVAARVTRVTAFVFSDDPVWARENLQLPCEIVYVTHNVGRRNHEDLRLMSACKHFIIANSTFSWWGAWLAENPDKIVVAPRQWRVDPNGIGDPVPDHWVRL